MSKIYAFADTLADAQHAFAAQVPDNHYWLNERQVCVAGSGVSSGRGETVAEAMEFAATRIPQGAVEERRQVRQQPERVTTTLTASSSDEAGALARVRETDAAVVDVTLQTPGRTGVLGFGARAAVYVVTLRRAANVDIHYTTRSRFEADVRRFVGGELLGDMLQRVKAVRTDGDARANLPTILAMVSSDAALKEAAVAVKRASGTGFDNVEAAIARFVRLFEKTDISDDGAKHVLTRFVADYPNEGWGEYRQRAEAARLLGKIRWTPAIPKLVAAFAILAQFSPYAEDPWSGIAADFEHGLRLGLAWMGEPAVEPVVAAATRGEPIPRIVAARTLGEFDHPRALDTLRRLRGEKIDDWHQQAFRNAIDGAIRRIEARQLQLPGR